MKTNLKFIGIDVSKYTLDICILCQGQLNTYVIASKDKAIRMTASPIKDSLKVVA